MVDRLFHETWRTDLEATADELGNVRARAFPGTYRLTATLPDGRELRTEIRLEKRSDERRS